MPQALFCRLLQLTVKRIGGKASSSVGFSPFNKGLSHWYLKGLKPTEESGKAGHLFIRSLKTNGKREPAAWGNAPLKEQTDKSSFIVSKLPIIELSVKVQR
ncbi:MAG: hypothetical protein LUH63_22475 [Parabacteroides sp.]|nr:hypothetical protein [Parabacteroides sp.]